MLYSFHPVANERQEEIWYYTFRAWGEAQADRYIRGLHERLASLAAGAATDGVHQVPEGILPGVKFFRYQHHYVFFRECCDRPDVNLQVLSILHERMDIPSRLGDELRQIAGR